VCDLDNLSKTSVEFRDIARSLRKHYLNNHVKKFAPVLADIKSINHEIIGDKSTLLNGHNLTEYYSYYDIGMVIRHSNSVFKFCIDASKKINLKNFNHNGIINMMKMSNNNWINEPHNIYVRDQSELTTVHTIIYIQEYNGVYSMILTETPPVRFNIV
jgi:hypothetical protein